VCPERIICLLCKKILCLQAEDFLAITSSEGRKLKDCFTENSGDGGKETKFSDSQQSQKNFF